MFICMFICIYGLMECTGALGSRATFRRRRCSKRRSRRSVKDCGDGWSRCSRTNPFRLMDQRWRGTADALFNFETYKKSFVRIFSGRAPGRYYYDYWTRRMIPGPVYSPMNMSEKAGDICRNKCRTAPQMAFKMIVFEVLHVCVLYTQ